jgi:hypothetical protein
MRPLTLFALLAALTAAGTAWAHGNDGRDFNAALRGALGGPENASGKVKFRQPEDEQQIVYLGVRVRGLLPDHSYYLQRATDPVVDDDCTGTNWLTLGYGLDTATVDTDSRGKGRALFWRDLAAVPEGTQFDIHFRVTDAADTNVIVLQSRCYQFTVRR